MALKRRLRSAQLLKTVPAPPSKILAESLSQDDQSSAQVLTNMEIGVESVDDEEFDNPLAKRARLEPDTTGSTNDTSNSIPLDRPAGPFTTNAPLKTPRGSRLVAYATGATESSPSKTGVPRPTTSTSQILDQACAHLVQADARMQPWIEKYPCRMFSAEGLAEEIDPFQSLCSGIMAQQVSGAAAKSIKNKFIALFREGAPETLLTSQSLFPSPAQVSSCEVIFLRKAGLSARKAEYIKTLAEKFANGDLTAAMLIKASDKEILEKLTAIRGLGLWSVQMFACFALKRTDIFSTGDLGVQRGMAAFIGKDVKKLKANKGGKWKYMSERDMLDFSAKFAPYR
ncbi:MAG: hypothetical protein LQ352_000806 [Teloschistes flavicans]|nr:MAG: hypothetical protein LQ352_000806 [Teloschistes flavicans]